MQVKGRRNWLERYCQYTDTDYGPRIWGNTSKVKEEIRPALNTFMLRRRLEEVAMDLPPLRVTVQYLDRDPDLAEKLEEYADLTDDPEHLSTLRRLLGEYKAPLVARILQEELDAGHDLVVLYHHRATGQALAEELVVKRGVGYSGFDGATPQGQRQQEIDHYQEHGGLFLAQQGAAGTGITLTRASEIVLVEPSWSPSENEQAIKRIHRIGQDRPCRARIFAVPDSLDEALMATLARKIRMVEEVLHGV
jgi:SNF2 family DNA or RNA helicase